MRDPYLYDDVPVLKNRLGIKDEKVLDLIESEQSAANMMLLYEKGFHDFSPAGLQQIHRELFCDVYDWAGEFRVINIQKSERVLAGKSVWYANDEDILPNLEIAFNALRRVNWENLSREDFVSKLIRTFPPIWRVHPFREGNTRTVVMLMTVFVEYYGYFMDATLLAASAGYVRDSFVMASIDQYSEYEYLEKILLDAITSEPIDDVQNNPQELVEIDSKYAKYQTESYTPQPHEQRPNHLDPKNYKM